MLEMITEHKHTDIVSKHDLLSSLINANNNEREGDGLTDSELMGILPSSFPLNAKLISVERKYLCLSFGGP